MVTPVFLLGNVSFGYISWKYNIDVLFYYNCIGALLILFAAAMYRKKKKQLYTGIVFTELFAFMSLHTIWLGWECGFQQYCIGFAASLIFADFFMHRRGNITRRAIVIGVSNVIVYLMLRLWTYRYPCMYVIENEGYVQRLYIINTLFGFWFLIMYLCIYSSTVRRLENELQDMANIDSLTGIFNRRKMMQLLKDNLEGKKKSNDRAVVAMLDVDYFKKVNDTYGHDAGDAVLVTLAQLLKKKQDEKEGFFVSRWGGEEFLVFCKDCYETKEDVMQEFEELRKNIQDTVVEYKGKSIRFTITIGLAIYEEGMTIQNLVNEADNRLYYGKRDGRNRVVL